MMNHPAYLVACWYHQGMRYGGRYDVANIPDRIVTKIDFSGDCWEWQGAKVGYGYGRTFFDGKVQLAHRVLYQLMEGPIPDGLELDHLCRNPACVRPRHMEAVTHRENTLRGVGFGAINSRKEACDNGHPFDEANTYIRPGGTRKCRKCANAASARYHHRKRVEEVI